MAWEKPNPDLIDLLEKSLEPYEVERKFMFGSPTFFVNNNMFAGVHQDTVIMRLSEQDREELFREHPDITLFTPMAGKTITMKEYAALPYDFCEDHEQFTQLLDKSYRFTASLPPKPVRKKKRK